MSNLFKVNKPILACLSAVISLFASFIVSWPDATLGMLNHRSLEEFFLIAIACLFAYLVSIFKLNLFSENNTNAQFFLDSIFLIILLRIIYILPFLLHNFI